jgi:hypothetical protein
MGKPVEYGEADFPEAHMLPEVVFDCLNPADADPLFLAARQAEFVLTVTPPAGTDPGRVAADVKPLLQAMHEYEIELGGDGLRFREEDAPAGSLAWRVSATRWDGAPDRLQKVRTALAHAEPAAGLRQAVQALRDRDITIAV